MRQDVRLAVTVVLGASYVALLAAAVLPAAFVFLVAAAIVVGIEIVLSRRAPGLLPDLLSTHLGSRFRLLSLDVLTAILAARLLPDSGGIVALAVVAVLLLAGGRDLAGVFARRVAWRRAGGPVSWRNLDVPGLPVPRPLKPTPEIHVGLTLLSLLIPLGYAIGDLHDRFGSAVLAQWIVIVVVVLFLAGDTVQYLVLNRVGYDAVRQAVRSAIAAAAPEVVLHHSGRRGTAEQVLLWVPALLALGRPCLIVVREASHLEALDGCGVPVAWAPRSQDVELFMVPSVDLALYPSDATNINNHLLRVPGVYDVLVGHGDSDEAENRNPIGRMYDEIWVAGPVGRSRYGYPASGVPASRLREIGAVRPALLPVPEPLPETQTRRPTVVYAPTWENTLDAADLSSVGTVGDQVLDALLARQDVRVLFVPAPATGARVPGFADCVSRLSRTLQAAGRDHATVPADRLRAALATAAFAVVDVSPAVAEAVRADVPFAVPALPRADAAEMVRRFPLVAAGTVLTRYPEDVFAALDDALGPDRHAADRAALAPRIDAPVELAQAFPDAVAEAIAVQRRRRAFARPGV